MVFLPGLLSLEVRVCMHTSWHSKREREQQCVHPLDLQVSNASAHKTLQVSNASAHRTMSCMGM